ncbi:MAG: TetR-like C-terminal domain-containing protein, partial [Acidimicrobiia bacterium]
HWPNRRDLISDAIEEHKPNWDFETSGDLGADLTSYLEKMVARLTSGPLPQFFVTLIERAEHDAEFADMHCRMAEHRSQPIVAVLEAAISRGELPKDLDVPAAIAAINGPIFYRRLITREPLTDSFVATIVNGFLARFS